MKRMHEDKIINSLINDVDNLKDKKLYRHTILFKDNNDEVIAWCQILSFENTLREKNYSCFGVYNDDILIEVDLNSDSTEYKSINNYASYLSMNWSSYEIIGTEEI